MIIDYNHCSECKKTVQNDMVNTIAHEVRNVVAQTGLVTRLSGMLEEIKKRSIENGNIKISVCELEKLTLYAEIITREWKCLEAFQKDSIESINDKLKYEETNISAVLKDAIETVRDNRILIGFSSNLKQNPVLDKVKIRIVIINILINAEHAVRERYAKEEKGWRGEISISCIKAGNNFILKITNNGGRIPSKHLDKIFNPFFSTKERGSGTGLDTSSKIIQAHDGKIVAENHGKDKVTFVITLPLKPAVS